MIAIDRSAIENAIANAGLEPEALYEGYSGRAMYGSECFGIVCSLGELLVFVANARERGRRDRRLGRSRSKRLDGPLVSIWYFPDVEIEKARAAS